MNSSAILILSGILFLFAFILWRISKKFKSNQKLAHSLKEKEEMVVQLSNSLAISETEKAELHKEKQKFEEKNRKLWQMSETVHKERKLVDEANEKLSSEKEKLEVDKKKLDEKIKKLWSTSTAIHKEKERINELKQEIEHKHQEILDSVNYAQRIQRALLASESILNQNLPDYFVFFQPKDIVSGDFYWAKVLTNGCFALVTADSTGHGVPGAIMSILNISCIEKAVEVENLCEPKDILNHTRLRIIETLKKDGSQDGGKDGMDCSLICFDFKNQQMHYAAANNSIYLVRTNPQTNLAELIELDPDSMPVGKHDRDNISFTQHTIALQKGDLIYTLTDGLPDQFGGPKGKKFMYKKLKELLVSNAHLPLKEQKELITNIFSEWRGNLEQVDDVTLIAVRV